MASKQDESEDSGQDIPFDQKDGANDEDAAEDGEQGGEEEYAVEKIIAHRFVGRSKELMYTVKWLGWDETTEEPEVNLDNCPDELNEYFTSIGGKPEPPNAASRKRSATSDTPAKKGRQSAAPPAKKTKRNLKEGQIESDDGTSWTAPAGSWEDQIINIDSLRRMDDGEIYGFIIWNNGRKSAHSTKLLNAKCPQKMLQFYEGHLFFYDDTKTSDPKTVASPGGSTSAKTAKAGIDAAPAVKEIAEIDDEDEDMESVKPVASS